MEMRFPHGLRFARQSRPASRRLVSVGLAVVIFTLLWVLVPHSTLYWLLLPLVMVLVWIASYGWRQALVSLHELIHRLVQE